MKDILGKKYDFILSSLPGEKSCRETILPFSPFVAKNAKAGDIIMGRPSFQGCPIAHVMEVVKKDKFGVLTVWMVGPLKSRSKKILDVGPYSVIGFEGLVLKGKAVWGHRHSFLPHYCMMHLGHTGLVNFISNAKKGTVVKLESIIIGV
jgi:uncharacterized Fe-S cluster-containing protein